LVIRYLFFVLLNSTSVVMNNNVMNNNSTGLSLFSMKTSRIFLFYAVKKTS
jgi:hypothetical protein